MNLEAEKRELFEKLHRYHSLVDVMGQLQAEIEQLVNRIDPFEVENKTRLEIASGVVAIITRDPMGEVTGIDFDYNM